MGGIIITLIICLGAIHQQGITKKKNQEKELKEKVERLENGSVSKHKTIVRK